MRLPCCRKDSLADPRVWLQVTGYRLLQAITGYYYRLRVTALQVTLAINHRAPEEYTFFTTHTLCPLHLLDLTFLLNHTRHILISHPFHASSDSALSLLQVVLEGSLSWRFLAFLYTTLHSYLTRQPCFTAFKILTVE